MSDKVCVNCEHAQWNQDILWCVITKYGKHVQQTDTCRHFLRYPGGDYNHADKAGALE